MNLSFVFAIFLQLIFDEFFSLLMVFYLTVIDILRFIFIWQCTLRCRDKKFPFYQEIKLREY